MSTAQLVFAGRATGKVVVPAAQCRHVSRRGMAVTAQHGKHEYRESTKDHLPRDEGLPVNMYVGYKSLPPDGKSIAPADEMCDPEVRKCKTATYVYESQCKACFGTGTIRGRSNGRRGALSTCPHCVGVGFVRRATTRFAPNVCEEGPHLSLNRDPSMNTKDQKLSG